MKNLFSYFALIAGAAVLTVACSKDNTTDPMVPKYRMATISFQASADNDTRTTVDAENNQLVWDEVGSELPIAAIELWENEIYGGVNLQAGHDRVGKGECTSVNNGNAKFTAQVATKDETDYQRGYLAVYPHGAFASMFQTTVRVNLPAQQTPSAVGNIDPNATLLFASDLDGRNTTPETLPLFFRHVAAYGAITVKNLKEGFGNLSQITITSNDNSKKLSGEWNINYTVSDDTNGSKGSNRDSDNSITLNVGHLDTKAATTGDGIRFYFSALPCGSLSDFTFTAVTDEGYKFTKTVSGSGTLEFNRAKREIFAVNFSGIYPESPDQLAIGDGWASESDKQSGGVQTLWDGTLDSKQFFSNDYGRYHSFFDGRTTFPVTIVLKLKNGAQRIDYINFYTRSERNNGLPGDVDVYYMECTENRTTADSSWQPAVKGKGGASNPMFKMNMDVYNPTPFRMDFMDEPLENAGWVKFVFYNGSGGYISGEEIQLFGLTSSRYPGTVQSNWTEDLKIVSGTASSFQPGLGVEWLFDGVILQSDNGNNIYHSNYNEKADAFPIELTFKLEKPSRVDQVVYYTRPIVTNGHPKKFDVYYRYSTSPEGTFFSLNGTYGEEATALFEIGNYAYLSGYRANLPYVLDDVIEIKLRFYPTDTGYLAGNEVQLKGVTIK